MSPSFQVEIQRSKVNVTRRLYDFLDTISISYLCSVHVVCQLQRPISITSNICDGASLLLTIFERKLHLRYLVGFCKYASALANEIIF